MPAPLLLDLTTEQIAELRQARRSASTSRIPERCRYVLLNAIDRLSCYAIAAQEQRDVRTIRYWLMAYQQHGLAGLKGKPRPGRSPANRNQVKALLNECLDQRPADYALSTELWTSALLAKICQDQLEFNVSPRTVRRALKELGWRYKRTAQAVPAHAPTKREKKTRSAT